MTRPDPEKSAEDLEEEAQRYKDNQKLRYLERKTREAKRGEAVALDDAAKRTAQAKVKSYQAKIREHVASTDAVRQPAIEQIGKAH